MISTQKLTTALEKLETANVICGKWKYIYPIILGFDSTIIPTTHTEMEREGEREREMSEFGNLSDLIMQRGCDDDFDPPKLEESGFEMNDPYLGGATRMAFDFMQPGIMQPWRGYILLACLIDQTNRSEPQFNFYV